MPPKSARFIPKKKVMDRLITAWATGNTAAHRAIFNSLSEPEKQYVRNMEFNMNYGPPLNPAAAAFVPAAQPLNPNAAPFETAAERNALMTNLAASGSKLPNWTRKHGGRKTKSKSRKTKSKSRKTKRKTKRSYTLRGGNNNDPSKVQANVAIANANNEPGNLNIGPANAAPAPVQAAAAPVQGAAANNHALNVNLQNHVNLENNGDENDMENNNDINIARFCVSLRGPDYVAFPPAWNGLSIFEMAERNRQRVLAEVHSPEVAALVIAWFNEHIDNNEGINFIIEHLHGSTYDITFDGEPDLEEELLNADPDGNYPLLINGVEHLVTIHDCYDEI